ncbi:flagellar filament capping protein FliD [Candidatus Dependentiae bacterium]|nr:flagellar filament capping protein FliD [Candidatus Dependentiae bacterium]
MRINEIVKLNELVQSETWKSKFGDSEYDQSIKNFTSEFSNSVGTLQAYSSFNSKIDALSFANNNLSSYADSLNEIDTKYENPVSGETQNSDQTIDSYQSSRLKAQISKYVSSYNAAIESSDKINSGETSKDLENIKPSDSLKNMGISKNEDGTLSFDESKFDDSVKSGETKISDLKSGLSDIKTLTNSTAAVIKSVSKDIDAVYSSTGEKITELQSNFTADQRDFIKNSLNSLFNSNSINSMMAGLGIGRNLNEIL